MKESQQMTSSSVAGSSSRVNSDVMAPPQPLSTVRRTLGRQRENMSTRAFAVGFPPPSSNVFQRVLDEMKRENEVYFAKLRAVSFFGVNADDGNSGSTDVDNEEPTSCLERPEVAEQQSVNRLVSADVPAAAASTINGRQAWARLRVHINVRTTHETDVTSRWQTLCRSVVDASHPDRARIELYRRYIDRPDAWKDGLAYYRNRKQPHHQLGADLQKNSSSQISANRRQPNKQHVTVS